MATIISRYLQIALTQGGADTFVQGSVDTGILPENGLAYKVNEIEISFSSSFAGLSADAVCRWSVTRDTKTGVAALSDPDVFLEDGFAVSLTTSGQILVPQKYRYPGLSGVYLVEPTVYAQLGSSGTGLTNVATMRLYYETIKVSEIDILRILNNN